MRKLLILLTLFTSISFAQTQINVDTQGLTTEQKAQLATQIEQMKSQSKSVLPNVDAIQPEVVDKWVTTGQHFGQMMGGAAKEVGVQVNDFVKTPVGLMTACLIIWNYMGAMITHVVIGLFFWITASTALIIYMRSFRGKVITYDESKTNIFGNFPVKEITRDDVSTDAQITFIILQGIVGAVSIITIFSY